MRNMILSVKKIFHIIMTHKNIRTLAVMRNCGGIATRTT